MKVEIITFPILITSAATIIWLERQCPDRKGLPFLRGDFWLSLQHAFSVKRFYDEELKNKKGWNWYFDLRRHALTFFLSSISEPKIVEKSNNKNVA